MAALSGRGASAAALLICGAGSTPLLLASNRFELLTILAVVLAPYIALSVAVWRTAQARDARTAGAVGALLIGLILSLSLLTAEQAAG